MRIIVGISGATGAIIGYRLLQALSCKPDIEVHLVVTQGAKKAMAYEDCPPLAAFEALAYASYAEDDMAALIASGSFKTAGMIVAPCSMKSLSAIAHGYADNLLVRAADVCLKEGRKLVLVPREMPLGKVHLKNMLEAADLGCAIVPPMLTFYNDSALVEDHINHIIGKVLMQFDLEFESFKPWQSCQGAFSEVANQRCRVEARVQRVGGDLHVMLTGGSRPHIGAVAFTSYNGQAAARVQVIQAEGHRDGVVAEKMAQELAQSLKCTVLVSAGIHIDDAVPEEVEDICKACQRLTSQILSSAPKQGT